MNLREGKGRKAGVVGMGRSGFAAARLLADRNFSVIGFDSSVSATSTEHISRSVFGEFRNEDLSEISVLVLSPGVPLSAAISKRALELKIPVVGEIELALQNTSAEILAVTGSNGKTTTVEWLTHVLRFSDPGTQAIAAGNMGYALSDAILDNPECPLFVLELSSYQLETTKSLKAFSAVILNLTPDHLQRHGTMTNYGDAKVRIFQNQEKTDTAILNFDDPLLEQFENRSQGAKMYFSLNKAVPMGAWLDSSGKLLYRDSSGTTTVMESSELSLPGRHNIANALAVICLAASAGIPVEKIAKGLKDFSGVPHRIEPLGYAAGLNWFNDSKSTNVDSLKVALECFDGEVVLLAGGKEKDSDYSVLNRLIEDKVKAIVLFGSGAESLSGQWSGTTPLYITETLEQAVEQTLRISSEGDTVLLSPGCASFDQYRNFEERGDHFKEIVRVLK